MRPTRNRVILWTGISFAAIIVLALSVGASLGLAQVTRTAAASGQESVTSQAPAPNPSAPLHTFKTPTPEPPPLAPPVPAPAPAPVAPPVYEPPAPICPAGQVNIIYSKMHLDGTAWTAGAVRNDSDTPVQILGLPGAWGVGADGSNLIAVGGYFTGPVDYLFPGESVGLTASSNPVTPEQLAAVAEWRFVGDGDYLSARWLVGPECERRAPLVLTVMN